MESNKNSQIFEIESAKNGRAGCKLCKQKCEKAQLRIGKIVPNPFTDGNATMKNWYHVDCMFEVFKKQRATTRRIEMIDDIIGYETLIKDDLEMIKVKIDELNQFFGNSPSKKVTKSTTTISTDNDNIVTSVADFKDNSFKIFQKIVKKISNTSSYLDKTNIINSFFTNGSDGNGFKGNIEIWCRLLLPGSLKRIYNLQSKQLIKLFSRILNESPDSMMEHLEQGDISETISHFYENSDITKPEKSKVTLQDIDTFLHYLSKLTREEDQIVHFETMLKNLTVKDLKCLIRLIKCDLKMGAGAKHVLEGIHPDAYNIYKTSKDLDLVIEKCFKSRKAQNAEIKLLTPVFPMLAEVCKSIDYAMKKCPNGMYSEIKYDGERVQVHKRGTDFKYFSRSLKPVLEHKVSHLKDYIAQAFPYGKDLILDTEILMMDTNTGKPLPFGTLGIHKKAQFKDATVCLFVFDCIYYNGENLLNKPLKDRKQILHENMVEVPNRIVFSEMKEINTAKKLGKMIVKVLKLGLEGLVLKDIMSTYEPSKRHWLKIKKDYLLEGAIADSADLIVLGAWYGTGQKGGMMSIFLMGCYNQRTDRFCTVTKVHTGIDDKTLENIQTELKMEKISCDPNKVPGWLHCTKTMIPDFVAVNPKEQPVWEITGAEFTQQHDVHTADGISIRFPRVTKIRNDKTWETATNLEELKENVKKSKEETDFSALLKDYNNEVDENMCTVGNLNSEKTSPRKRKLNTTLDSLINNNKSRKIDDINNTKIDVMDKLRSVRTSTPLPNIFENTKGKFISKRDREMQRYFVAYGGTIVNTFSEATHIFHSESTVTKISDKWPKSARHVHINWIVHSVNSMKQQPYRNYFVTLESKE